MNRHRPLKIIAALAALAWTAGAGLAADVPGHISYQGMLMDGSTPFTGEANFRFALVDSLTGDTFWTNDGTAGYPAEAVRIGVQDGVFSVLLGAAPMAPIDPSTIATFTRDQALRIWVEIGSHGEVLLGNLPLSSVLFAHQAELARASDGDFAAQGEIWSQSGGFRFPDGTVQETAAGSGGGDCLWTAGTYSKIYYNAGNVGIGTDNPQYPLSLQKSAGSNIVPMAIFQTTGTGSAAALRFQNALDDHFNLGITGGSHLALGYNANIGLSGDVVRITPDGDVGIGRTNPSAKLDVNGSVRMTGLRLGTSATAGHVLTADASGVGTWQPPPGGSYYWINDGEDNIYYNSGNVGIGMGSEQPVLQPLHVIGTTYLNGNVGIGVAEPASALDVAGTAKVTGFQLGTTATVGHVLTANANGIGTWQAPAGGGEGHWSSGTGGAIYYDGGNVGIGTASPTQKLQVGDPADSATYLRLATTSAGYSGIQFWDGESAYSGMLQYNHPNDYMRFYTRSGGSSIERLRITSTGDVGIGTTSPEARLHVNGTTRMNGFQLGTSATAGYVLTANASGVGTWQAPTGGGEFGLPYDGEVSFAGAALKIKNTLVNSYGIHGVADGGNARGVYGQATNGGAGVYGFSGAGDGIYGGSNSGTGVYGQAHNEGGVAVMGRAGSSAVNSTGGWFEASASTGKAVYALSANGIAVEATSSNIGLKATGGQAAAEFYGNLKIYEHGTTNLVLELGKGLDYAEGFNVSTKNDHIGPGTVLVIDSEHPGMLAISTQAYDRRVAGIVSGANNLGAGVRLGGDIFDHDVALAGRVYCNVVAGDDPIQPGDLLTTSRVPGYAMKVTDAPASQGAILGKAMEPLAAGQRGMILVLVTLQ
jgi:hypothetical protein